MIKYNLAIRVESRDGKSHEAQTTLSTIHNRQSAIQTKLYKQLSISGDDARNLARFGTITLFTPAPVDEEVDGWYPNTKAKVIYTLTKIQQ
jgi:hypothetical protein